MFAEFSQGMILPSKDSPVLQRAAADTQNNEIFEAAVNNPAGIGDNNKNNSKLSPSFYKEGCDLLMHTLSLRETHEWKMDLIFQTLVGHTGLQDAHFSTFTANGRSYHMTIIPPFLLLITVCHF